MDDTTGGNCSSKGAMGYVKNASVSLKLPFKKDIIKLDEMDLKYVPCFKSIETGKFYYWQRYWARERKVFYEGKAFKIEKTRK